MKKILIYTLIGAYLSGCASNGVKDDNNTARDCTLVGVGAAAICGLASGKAKNAAICAALAVGACLVYKSYVTKQTKTAEEVNEEYKTTNPQLPEKPTLVEYSTDISSGTINRDDTVYLKSKATVVEGTASKNVLLEEKLEILDKNNNNWAGNKKKTLAKNAGEFQNEFSFSPAKLKMEQGKYVINRTLYLNGTQVAAKSNQSLQIVKVGENHWFASIE